jgi:hypothetical protein
MNAEEFCPKCGSTRTIKHGFNVSGARRYRCRLCETTWSVNKKKCDLPHPAEIAEKYLNGSNLREIAVEHNVSVIKINGIIRTLLSSIPDWSSWLKALKGDLHFNLVYTCAARFSCKNDSGYAYLLTLIDAFSGAPVAVEICSDYKYESWLKLMINAKKLGCAIDAFMETQTNETMEAIKTVFPESAIVSVFDRALRLVKIRCCLKNSIDKKFLAANAIKMCDLINSNNELRVFISREIESISRKISEKLENDYSSVAENFIKAFKERFVKFHSIKDDAYPVVNAWIYIYMLNYEGKGRNRLCLALGGEVYWSLREIVENEINSTITPIDCRPASEKRLCCDTVISALLLPINSYDCSAGGDICPFSRN